MANNAHWLEVHLERCLCFRGPAGHFQKKKAALAQRGSSTSPKGAVSLRHTVANPETALAFISRAKVGASSQGGNLCLQSDKCNSGHAHPKGAQKVSMTAIVKEVVYITLSIRILTMHRLKILLSFSC